LRGLVSLTVVLCFALGGCGKNESTSATPDASVNEPMPAAPADLLAEGVVPTPDSSWGKLQRAVGGTIGLVPSTLGGLITALGGVDSSVALEIDGMAPAYFAASGSPSDPSWVVVSHLRDARHARAELAIGDGGRFKAKEAHGMTVLVPVGLSNVVVALDRDRLLVAKREDDLDKLGAYAARTLPQKPVPNAGLVATIPESGVRALSTALGDTWSSFAKSAGAQEKDLRDKHGGKQADFADTEALLAIADGFVKARVSEIADVSGSTITVDFDDTGLHVTSLMHPKDGDGPAKKLLTEMTTGDAEPLLASTGDARASFLVRASGKSRGDQATALTDMLARGLGARLGDADKKSASAIARGWEKGAGEATVVSLPAAASRVVLVRSKLEPAGGEAAMKDAIAAVPPFLRAKAVSDPLAIKSVDVGERDLPAAGKPAGGGKANVVNLLRAPPKPEPGKSPRLLPPAGVASTFVDGAVVMAIGDEPFDVLSHGARPDRTLGDDPLLAGPLRALGNEAAFVVLWQPLKLEPSHLGEPPAPVVVAWGKRGGDALLRVDASLGLMKDLSKKGGF
jgi:hypothetical protein